MNISQGGPKASGSADETETVCVQLSRIRKDFETKLYHARCAAESCADENAVLLKEKNDLLARLKEEEAAQKRAESDAEKMRLTLRFERDLHRQEIKEITKQSTIKHQRNQIQISEKYKARMNESLNALRIHLEDQLRLNHMNFDNHIKNLQGPVLSVDAGGGAIASISGVQDSLIASHTQIATLQAQLLECQACIDNFEMQMKYWQKILEDDQCQMDCLQQIIQELCQKYQKLLDDKTKIQSELDNYNGILLAEESRLELTDMCDAKAFGKEKATVKAGNESSGSSSGSDSGSDSSNTGGMIYECEIDYFPKPC